MFRTVIAVVFVLFVMGVYMVVAPAMIEPLADEVTDSQAVQDRGMDTVPADVEQMVFVAVPLLTMGGVAVMWAAVRIARKERVTTRGLR